jgi:hypothetical protein
MSSIEDRLDNLRAICQVDPGERGLAMPPELNAFTERAGDLAVAAHGLCAPDQDGHKTRVGILTGFHVPVDEYFGAFETDGPPGAVFLARTLLRLGMEPVLFGEPALLVALEAGLNEAGLGGRVRLIEYPRDAYESGAYVRRFHVAAGRLTHLVSIERPGPSHSLATLRARSDYVPDWDLDFKKVAPPPTRDRYLTMSGLDVTHQHSPAHWLFEQPSPHGPWQTIGVGDGGNEIGMGALPWDLINATIPEGGRIHCRVPTDSVIVAGVSNWGAYALSGALLAIHELDHCGLFDANKELEILKVMVEQGGLIDGRTKEQACTVDGLPWDSHAEILSRMSSAIG